MAINGIELGIINLIKDVQERPSCRMPKRDGEMIPGWHLIAPEVMARQGIIDTKMELVENPFETQATPEEILAATKDALIRNELDEWRPKGQFPRYGLGGFENALSPEDLDASITAPHDLFEGRVVDLPTMKIVEDVA